MDGDIAETRRKGRRPDCGRVFPTRQASLLFDPSPELLDTGPSHLFPKHVPRGEGRNTGLSALALGSFVSVITSHRTTKFGRARRRGEACRRTDSLGLIKPRTICLPSTDLLRSVLTFLGRMRQGAPISEIKVRLHLRISHESKLQTKYVKGTSTLINTLSYVKQNSERTLKRPSHSRCGKRRVVVSSVFRSLSLRYTRSGPCEHDDVNRSYLRLGS